MRLLSYFVFTAACLLAILSACESKETDSQVFRLSDDRFSQWQELIDVKKVTQLRETDSCLMSYAAACVVTSDNIIYEDYKSKRIHVFSTAGEFLRTVGDIGRAASEYVNIRDLVVSADGHQLSVLDDRGIVSYDVHTGKFVSRTSFSSSEFMEYERFAPIGSDRYLCFTDSRNEHSIVLDAPDGQKGLRKGRRFHFVTHPFYRYDCSYRVLSDYGDFYIDAYEDGRLKKLYKIDLGGEALPEDVLPQEYEEFSIVNSSSDYYKCITNACETKDWLYLELVGPNQEYYSAFINKNDGKYVLGKVYPSLGISIIGTRDDMFCGIIYPEFVQPDMLAKKILNEANIQPENVSPVIIYFTLNEILS